MLKRYIILIGFSVAISSINAKTANITLDALVDICQAYENALNDLTVDYDFEISGPSTEQAQEGDLKWVGPQKTTFYASKPFLERYKFISVNELDDLKGRVFESYEAKSYNGKAYKEYHKNRDDTTATGLIAKAPDAELAEAYYNLTPLGFTIFHQPSIPNTSILDILKGRSDTYSAQLCSNITKVQDFNTVEVICTFHIKDTSFKAISMFFSIDHNYTLVKIAYYSGTKISLVYEVSQLKAISGNLWFPVKATLRSNEDENKLTVHNVLVNQKLCENTFDIQFPASTKVRDNITGKQYTIKPTQEQLDQTLTGN